MSKLNNIIKFNNNYPKLHGQASARLLMAITEVPGDMLRTKFSDFLIYDTRKSDGMFYDNILPEKKYILLLFLGDKNILFSTLRADNIENKNKYCDLIGDVFDIEVEKER